MSPQYICVRRSVIEEPQWGRDIVYIILVLWKENTLLTLNGNNTNLKEHPDSSIFFQGPTDTY